MVEKPPGALHDHFLEGRQYSADEIGEVVAQRNWWRLATLALSGVLGCAVLGLVYVGAQPKVVPYIVTWNIAAGSCGRSRPSSGSATNP